MCIELDQVKQELRLSVTPHLSLPFISHFNEHSINEMLFTFKNMFTKN